MRAQPRASSVLNPRRTSATSGGNVLALPAPSGTTKVVFRRSSTSVLCTLVDPSASGALGWSPIGFVPCDLSPLFWRSTAFAPPPPITCAEVVTVYTDGSGHKVTGLLRAGYGVFFSGPPHLRLSQPLLGKTQSVQRAEVAAVCLAIQHSVSRLCVVSDNSYVVHTCSFSFAVASVLHPIRSFGSMYGHTVDASQWCGGLKPTAPRPSLLHEACLWLIGQVTRRRIPWPSPEFYPIPPTLKPKPFIHAA